jgi:penicillin amidase
MRLVWKWLPRAAAIVLAGVALVALIVFLAIRGSMSPSNGEARMAGLSATVHILRDRNGIPHIEAETAADAMQALGFAHAQDRFWQMHVLRMVAQGRLSEMFGEATIDADIFLKTIDLAGAAKSSFAALSEDGRAALAAYARGVNAHLQRRTRLLEPRLPPEFMILGLEAEPWEPWQSVAIIKVMAQTLDSNVDEEIRRLALAARGFSPAEIDELMPYGPRDRPPALPDLRKMFEFQAIPQQTGDAGGAVEGSGLPWETGIDASNNWVVAGARTQSGKPLLANDPHLGLTAPSTFYLAHLAYGPQDARRNIIGGSLPGTPLILVGRNDRIAWGLTTTNLDSQDLYIEKLQTKDPSQYLAPEGWRRLEATKVEIAVKGRAPVVFERRVTRHGPVLPDKYRGLARLLPQDHVAALQWVALAGDDTTVDAALAIGRAGSVAEFIEATRKIVAPMQSMVVADVDGAIALVAPGRAPVRDPQNLLAGRAPAPGWIALYDWTGVIAHEELPRIENPASGALATANANWLPETYRRHITYDWDEHFRQGRVEDLVIGAKERHSMASMQAIQLDDYSPALAQFRDEALTLVVGTGGRDPDIMTALKEWDGRMNAGRPEPLIATAWWRHFEGAVFRDDLGPDFDRFAKGYLDRVLRILRGEAVRDWCDDLASGSVESCGLMLSRALTAAIGELEAAQGKDWRQWRWGKAHVSIGEHRPFTSVAPLAGLFTIENETHGGSYTLLRGRTDFRDKRPYANLHASAYRAVYDLAAPDNSLFIISSGQSGHFLSPHYRDLAGRWAGLDYLPMTTRREDYSAGAEGEWLLEPAQ